MLKRVASPTFTATVNVRVQGGETHQIKATYKHMTKDAFEAYFAKAVMENWGFEKQLLGIAENWEGVEFPFTEEGLRECGQQYPAVCHQLVHAYSNELIFGRLGN